MSPKLASVHRWMGILVVIAFLLTGQYMDKVHDHLIGMEGTQRMLFRSTHLYILFAGLMNLMLGLSRPGGYDERLPALLQRVGSLFVLVVPLLLLAGFFSEPNLADFARPWTRPAAYLALAGGVLLWAARTIDTMDQKC